MHDTKYFDPNRHATWLEGFFDLIFVVAIDDVTHILSHTHEGHLDPLQFWKFVLVFIPLWWIWASHTMYANRFDTDDRKHRLATLFIMFLLIIISGLIGQRFLASYEAIVVCYAGAKYIIAMMYFVSKQRHKESVGLTTAVGWVIVAGATISLASVLFPAPQRYVVFYLGILFDLVTFMSFLRRRLQVIPAHTEHLIERVGLLTIIILGESVSSLSIGLANLSWTGERLLAAPVLALFRLHRPVDPCQPDPARDPGRHGAIRFPGTVGRRRGLLFHWQAVRLFHGASRVAAPAGCQYPRRLRVDRVRPAIARNRLHPAWSDRFGDLLCFPRSHIPEPCPQASRPSAQQRYHR
jgi:hypothetical protein